MKFQPFDDFLCVLAPVAAVTERGLHLPDNVQKQFIPHRGEVVAVGPGRLLPTGVVIPLPVTVGEEVIWNPMAGVKVTIEGTKLLILHIGDCYGGAFDDEYKPDEHSAAEPVALHAFELTAAPQITT